MAANVFHYALNRRPLVSRRRLDLHKESECSCDVCADGIPLYSPLPPLPPGGALDLNAAIWRIQLTGFVGCLQPKPLEGAVSLGAYLALRDLSQRFHLSNYIVPQIDVSMAIMHWVYIAHLLLFDDQCDTCDEPWGDFYGVPDMNAFLPAISQAHHLDYHGECFARLPPGNMRRGHPEVMIDLLLTRFRQETVRSHGALDEQHEKNLTLVHTLARRFGFILLNDISFLSFRWFEDAAPACVKLALYLLRHKRPPGGEAIAKSYSLVQAYFVNWLLQQVHIAVACEEDCPRAYCLSPCTGELKVDINKL